MKGITISSPTALLLTLAMGLSMGLAACGPKGEKGDKAAKAEKAETPAASPNKAASPTASASTAAAQAPQAPPVDLAATDVVQARTAAMTQVLAISGSLKAVQSAFVKARIAAEIKSLNVREGDRVSAGQLLGKIDATEALLRLRQAQDQAASAQAQLGIAQSTMANNRALVEQGFISRSALDTSEKSAAGAQASLHAAEAAVALARKQVADTDIRAPISGLISQRLAQPGERVGVDARILEIVDLSQVELEAAVAPEDAPSLRVGQQAKLRMDGLEEDLTAQVARINPSAVAGSRAVLAYLRVGQHPALRQGLFARGQIDLDKKSVLAIPASAVRSDQATPYVLVVSAGKAQAQSVALGVRGEVSFVADASKVEPAVQVSGLQEGATVLRASVGSLPAGSRVALPASGLAASEPAKAP